MNVMQMLEEVITKTPLYKKVKYEIALSERYVQKLRPINFYCDGRCRSVQTFALYQINDERVDEIAVEPPLVLVKGSRQLTHKTGTKTYLLAFQCQKCAEYTVESVLRIAITSDAEPGVLTTKPIAYETTVEKIGQFPSYEKSIDDELKRWFKKKDAELYEKGLRSESNGYGIGAYGYFRRIIENNIEQILDDIALTTDSQELKDAITEAKEKHNAQDRLEIVKEHTPASLQPGGQNVFKILYAATSEGLHGGSDEKCLEDAVHIRTCLNFLIKKVSMEKEEGRRLSEAIIGLTSK